MSDIEDRIKKLQAEKQAELNNLEQRYKHEEDAILSQLKAEISRLTTELKSAQKAYEKLTGRTVTRTPRAPSSINSAMNSEGMLQDIMLSLCADGQEHRLCDFELKAQEHGYNKTSAAPTLNRLRKKGQLERIKHGVYRKLATAA